MNLRNQVWWVDILKRLQNERLSLLAKEYNVPIEQLAEALAQIGQQGPAEQAPWWPEARRMLKRNVSIREIARRFCTNPRRLRRALARAGLRVAGEDVGGKGLMRLSPWREQFGRVPDGNIARSAKVAVEAVKGERRRLHIPAFFPEPGYRPGQAMDEEAWALGPLRPRRERLRLNTSGLQVVRRPGGREDGRGERTDRLEPAGESRELEVLEEQRGRTEEQAGSAEAGSAAAGAPEAPRRRVVRALTGVPVEARAEPDGPRAEVSRAGLSKVDREQKARDSVQGGRPSPRPSERPGFWDERRDRTPIEELIAPRKLREGRERKVRDAPILEPEEAAPARRRYTRSQQTTWREVPEAVIEQAQQQAAAAPPPPEPSLSPLGAPLRPEERTFRFQRILEKVREPGAAPGRGRPPEIPEDGAAPRRRGRPPKIRDVVADTGEIAAPRRRGRPPRIRTPEELAALAAPRRRGRPPKPRLEAPEIAPVLEPGAARERPARERPARERPTRERPAPEAQRRAEVAPGQAARPLPEIPTMWQVMLPSLPSFTLMAFDLGDAAEQLTELLPEEQLPLGVHPAGELIDTVICSHPGRRAARGSPPGARGRRGTRPPAHRSVVRGAAGGRPRGR